MEDLLYWIRFSIIPNIGNKRLLQLIEYFGSPQNLFMSSKAELKVVPLLNEAIIEDIKSKTYMNEAEKHLENIHRNNIKVITIKDINYPEYLKNIFDPPAILYCKGNLEKDDKTIGIVGSRKATEYGLKIAESIAYELAGMGITIVSGMARGVDSYAHRGALRAKGKTIAVLGCGLDKAYPVENSELMANIAESGAVVSEYLPGMPPLPKNFPARNRIISGMSLGVVIVEANEKSGSLITADFALEQGREVFAVPGNVYSINSKGTNKLIKEGAKIVTDIDDILEEIKIFDNYSNSIIKRDLKKDNLFKGLDKEELEIVRQIENEPVHIDVLASKCGFSIQLVNSLLIIMELKGIVEQMPGKIFKLKE